MMRFALVSIALLALALPAAAGDTPPAAKQFAKLKPNKTKRATVLKVLGTPNREDPWHAEKGATPVHVPYRAPADDVAATHNPFDSITGPLPERKKAAAAPPEDMLKILEYPGHDGRQPYYVVLKNDVVFYTIGPPSRGEHDPAQSRCGHRRVRGAWRSSSGSSGQGHMAWAARGARTIAQARCAPGSALVEPCQHTLAKCRAA